MSNVKSTLERLFESVISSSDKTFYLEINKYLRYLYSKRQLKKIVRKLVKESRKDSKEYCAFCDKLVKRFSEIKELLINKTKGNEGLKDAFKEFDNLLSRKITSSAPLAEGLYYTLQEILSSLKENKNETFPDIEKEILDLFKKYYNIKKTFEHRRDVSEWYALFFIEQVNVLNEDLSNCKWDITTMGKAILLGGMEKVNRGEEQIKKEYREEYTNHLRKINKYLIDELSEDYTIKNPYLWVPILIILPLFFSFLLYSPFAVYDINNNLIKQVGFNESINKYTLEIEMLNESSIKDELIANSIEEFTRTSLKFNRYELYFKDTSFTDNPDKLIIKYNMTFGDNQYQVDYHQKTMLADNFQFSIPSEVVLQPIITIITKNNSQINDSSTFRLSYQFFVKKSMLEFIIKFIFFYMAWISVVMIVSFVISMFLKKNGT